MINKYFFLAIQYGYVIFFVAAFPLAPFFAFINNIAEIRIDAQKFLLHNRRPIPKRISGIGAWNGILQAATYLGIVTNVSLNKSVCKKWNLKNAMGYLDNIEVNR